MPDFVRIAVIYAPLSLIGVWRWSFWIVRRFASTLYKPKYQTWPTNRPKPTVSIVTPVYNEDKDVFEEAMQSWIRNGVDEIIAVIDKTNKKHIVDFERSYAGNASIKTKCKMIVTPKPGKRAALCDGIQQAKGDIITLVDSDTIWDDNVLKNSLPLFLDKKVGGTTVAQRIQNPDTVGNVMFDILLWTRYREEVPFLLAVGKVFNTLSGRTAFYRREAILNDKYDNIHDLRHEFFLGTRGISGDDKRLTHLIIEQGWQVSFALGAEVFTPGLGSIGKFLKQRLRWTRNSWRADLRAIKKKWAWRHPALAIFMIDRFIQPFFMLLGPVACALAIASGEWLALVILVAWWVMSRFIRLSGYFRLYPKRLVYLPAYILFGYVNSIIKIYALATLIENSWATRWHKARAKKKRYIRRWFTVISGVTAVVVFLVGVLQFNEYMRAQSGASIDKEQPITVQDLSQTIVFTSTSSAVPQLPPGSILPTGVKRYTVVPGDSLIDLSVKFKMTVADIKKLNGLRDPDVLGVGQVLLYFGQ